MKPEPKAKDAVALSTQQQAVMDAVKLGKNVLVTGSAGTGKSTLLKAMIATYGAGEFPVTASTGIAAVNVGGTTVHSWAGIGLGDEPAEKIVARMGKKAYERIKYAKRLALDEVSMIGGMTFGLLDAVFRLVRGNDRPFGGVQLVLFGDFLQLPPVTKSMEEERQGRFAFQTRAWQQAEVGTAMLTKVFRQADAEFSGALNDIRLGELTDRAIALLRARFKPADDTMKSVRPVVVHTHNADVDAINAEKLCRLEKPEESYEARDSGTNPGALAMLQKNCLAPAKLKLRVGAQVMLLKNLDPLNGLANGSIGVVTKFAEYTKLPVVKFATGAEIEVERGEWDIRQDGEVVASRSQVPLRLAWAITAHKSQGMTLDKIQCHLGRAFEHGQSYVALSRARTAAGLFIMDGDRSCIKAHPDAVAFYQTAQSIL